MSPEEKVARENLDEAIKKVLGFMDDNKTWLLSDYCVITAQHRYDEDGETLTAVGHIYRNDEVPMYRVLGLLEFAVARIKSIICED